MSPRIFCCLALLEGRSSDIGFELLGEVPWRVALYESIIPAFNDGVLGILDDIQKDNVLLVAFVPRGRPR